MKKQLLGISLGTILGISCGSTETYNINNTTIITNGYSPDIEKIRELSSLTIECLESKGFSNNKQYSIEVMTTDRGFFCGYEESPTTGLCYGDVNMITGRIRVTESLSALPHELTHLITGIRTHDPPFPYECANIGTDGE